MTKYIDLVAEIHGKDITDIEETASILKEKLEARIAHVKAEILDIKSRVREAERYAREVRASVTTDIDDYLAGIIVADENLREEREHLDLAIEVLDLVKEIYEMF